LDLGSFSSFLIHTQSVGLLEREISQSQDRYLHRTAQTQNKRTQTSMPRLGFEPTTPVIDRVKTVQALHDVATAKTVIQESIIIIIIIFFLLYVAMLHEIYFVKIL
jgi:hypothetical protein